MTDRQHHGTDRWLDPHAPWRQPASDTHRALLHTLRLPVPPGLTTGEAGELLTVVMGDWR